MSASGFFISGTDTGVGKTHVAVALTRAFATRGFRVAAMKPVAAGARETAEGQRNDDAAELQAAANVAASYDDVNPWLLRLAASPHLAARAEGLSITHDRIIAAYQRLASQAEVVIVEGAGGWLAPISARETMADVAQRLDLPVVLVVGLRLGCLNHALLTRESIRAQRARFGGWIANSLQPELPFARENIETLAARFQSDPLAVVPFGVGTDGSWARTVSEKLVASHKTA